jgi:hypothetical protein
LLGLVYTILKFLLKKNVRFSTEELFLIYGIFFSIFFFHSFAWYKGIFHSFGLIRVMVGVLPLIAIICAKAVNETVVCFTENKFTKYILIIALVTGIIINFSITKYAIIPQRDLYLRGDQQCQKEIADYLWQNHKDCYQKPMYYTAPYISVVLNRDHFDYKDHPDFKEDFHQNKLQKPCYILWDDWYSPVESNIKQEDLEAYPEIKMIKKFWHWDIAGGKERITILYKLE